MFSAFVQNLSSLTEYDQNFLYAAPISLFFDTTASNPIEVAKQLREFYFGDRPITMDLFKNLTDVSIFSTNTSCFIQQQQQKIIYL